MRNDGDLHVVALQESAIACIEGSFQRHQTTGGTRRRLSGDSPFVNRNGRGELTALRFEARSRRKKQQKLTRGRVTGSGIERHWPAPTTAPERGRLLRRTEPPHAAARQSDQVSSGGARGIPTGEAIKGGLVVAGLRRAQRSTVSAVVSQSEPPTRRARRHLSRCLSPVRRTTCRAPARREASAP